MRGHHPKELSKNVMPLINQNMQKLLNLLLFFSQSYCTFIQLTYSSLKEKQFLNDWENK